MAFVIDAALDAALDYIRTNGTTLHLCTSEPANYAAIAAAELASAPVTLSANADGDTSGRKVTIPAITGDDVDTTGTATHWALSNGTDTLVATNSLTASVSLDASGTYNFSATDIEIADFVSE